MRYYFTNDECENVCADHLGNIRGARTKAQKIANERGEIIYINSCSPDEIVDVIYPDEPETAEQQTAEQAAAETETAQKQNIKENPEIKAMLNDTYADYFGNLRTVEPEQLEKFKNLVTEIKQILSCDTEIMNGNLDSLPENKKACVNGINIERELIIIDNFYIDMMEYEGTEKVIETICHEIAHNRYWNHTKWHRQLTKEYCEKVIDYLTKHTGTAETEQEAETKSTYEHALKMAMYSAECGDGVQAIYHKDSKFKAGLESDRQYAEKNGWQYFHTVWETVPGEERTKQQKHDQIKEARKKSLFWSRRLSYKSADSHPEWREKYKSAKQELERAKAELNKEETIMSMNTTTANAFEIEFKANNPEEQKYLDMIQKVERMGTIRYRFTIADNFCMDMVICEHDLNDKNDLMNLWYKHGYVEERTLTHMGLECYYTDFENGCYGRYNPTETKSKLNFEWVLPYTPENLGKLLAEAIKRYDDDSDMFVVDVNGSLTYANSVIPKGESPEEAVEEAFAKAHEDAERYAEYKKRYPENAEYWQKQIDECKNADYRAMRSSDFSRIQRQKFLRQPLHEVTAEAELNDAIKAEAKMAYKAAFNAALALMGGVK